MISWNAATAAARVSALLLSVRMCSISRSDGSGWSFCISTRNAAASVPATVIACVFSNPLMNSGKLSAAISRCCTSPDRDDPCTCNDFSVP